eukprot:UN16368
MISVLVLNFVIIYIYQMLVNPQPLVFMFWSFKDLVHNGFLSVFHVNNLFAVIQTRCDVNIRGMSDNGVNRLDIDGSNEVNVFNAVKEIKRISKWNNNKRIKLIKEENLTSEKTKAAINGTPPNNR